MGNKSEFVTSNFACDHNAHNWNDLQRERSDKPGWD